jgi:serine/threonine-protein kinase
MADLPEPPPSNGPIAGKYALVRLIGRGGMGTVWEGRHVSLGTRVAIKFIDVEYTDSHEARARFDNEARAAATIQSKHAIQIFDHGVTDDGKPYIVMEMLQGEPLDGRLERVGRLPLADTARILRQVGRALSRAHERGIVHRDLKPENIFLVRTPDDDDEIAKVLDFGIAKFKKMDGQSGGLTSSTKTGAVLGTPFYMAPEQARGLRDLDYRVDLWSMGVIAFKCVCGVLPFEGVSVGDLLVKICTTPAPVPSSIVPGVGQAFDAWFLRALEKDPARRFQSALELTDALAAAAGLSVKRAGSMSPISDPGAVPATSSPPQMMRSSGHGTSAPFTQSNPKAPSSAKGMWMAAGIAVLVGGGVAGVGGWVLLRPRADALHTGPPVISSVTVATVDPPVKQLIATAAVDAGAPVMTDVLDTHATGAKNPHRHGGSQPPPPKAGPSVAPAASVPAFFPQPQPQQVVAAPPPLPDPTPPPKPAPKPAPKTNSNDLGY